MVDDEQVDGVRLWFELEAELLLERGGQGEVVRPKRWIGDPKKSEIVIPLQPCLVQNWKAQLLLRKHHSDEVRDGNSLTNPLSMLRIPHPPGSRGTPPQRWIPLA
jgi:hypothetical protein